MFTKPTKEPVMLPRTHAAVSKTGIWHRLEYAVVPVWRETAWTHCGLGLTPDRVEFVKKSEITSEVRLCKKCWRGHEEVNDEQREPNDERVWREIEEDAEAPNWGGEG